MTKTPVNHWARKLLAEAGRKTICKQLQQELKGSSTMFTILIVKTTLQTIMIFWLFIATNIMGEVFRQN